MITGATLGPGLPTALHFEISVIFQCVSLLKFPSLTTSEVAAVKPLCLSSLLKAASRSPAYTDYTFSI